MPALRRTVISVILCLTPCDVGLKQGKKSIVIQCEARPTDLVSQLEVKTIGSCTDDCEKVAFRNHRVAVLKARLVELLQVPTTGQVDSASMAFLGGHGEERWYGCDIGQRERSARPRRNHTTANKNKTADQKQGGVWVSVHLARVARVFW